MIQQGFLITIKHLIFDYSFLNDKQGLGKVILNFKIPVFLKAGMIHAKLHQKILFYRAWYLKQNVKREILRSTEGSEENQCNLSHEVTRTFCTAFLDATISNPVINYFQHFNDILEGKVWLFKKKKKKVLMLWLCYNNVPDEAISQSGFILADMLY